MKQSALAVFVGTIFGMAVMGGAINYNKNTTPSITHDTVYVLINTDTLYDNAVRVNAVDSNCYSTHFEKIKDSVVNFR